MIGIFSLFKIELKKLKYQHFFTIWFFLSLATLIWILYPGSRNSGSTRFIIDNPVLSQYQAIGSAIVILSLILPIMAGVLISKLIEMEHKGEGFKLLRSNNQSLAKISDIKFAIVYLLMEITTILAIVASVIQIYLLKGIPIPVSKVASSIFMISLVNFINLLILGIFSFYFKNQLIVLVSSLFVSMINIMSTLFPPIIVRFLPFSYYTLCILSKYERIGTDSDGLALWKIVELKPEYSLIIIAFFISLAIYIIFRKSIENKEF